MMTFLEELRRRLHYDPETGIFTWKVGNPKRGAGEEAGYVTNDGYVNIGLLGSEYGAHRLAWLYVTGDWPKHEIDHRDLDKANNKFSNLRDATDAQNIYNRTLRSDNTSGYKGVSRWRHTKWQAGISYRGKRIALGIFNSPEEAAAAYAKAAIKYHAEFARVS